MTQPCFAVRKAAKAHTERILSLGLFNYMKTIILMYNSAKFMGRLDGDNRVSAEKHTRRDEDDLLFESSTIRRRTLQPSARNTAIARRGHEKMDERNTANN